MNVELDKIVGKTVVSITLTKEVGAAYGSDVLVMVFEDETKLEIYGSPNNDRTVSLECTVDVP